MNHGYIEKLECPPRIAMELGYLWEQRKGQRHLGPIHDWIGNPPRGTEVFIGKIPRDSDENELVPLFSRAGKIYTMRIMMDFSGFNRGFAFVRYTTKADALRSVEMFNGFRLRGERRIGVSLSVDNCRLFIGGLPKMAKKEDVWNEFRNTVKGLINVIMYPNPKDPNQNRGFAFLEFDSHQSAAEARRDLIPCPETSLGKLMVDWAEPEPEVNETVMEKVKILYVRNINLNTTEETLMNLFDNVIKPDQVHRVKKIKDFAFVHFYSRTSAETAYKLLNEITLEGNVLEIQWARPVEDKSLYKLKKLINKGYLDDKILQDGNNFCNLYRDKDRNTDKHRALQNAKNFNKEEDLKRRQDFNRQLLGVCEETSCNASNGQSFGKQLETDGPLHLINQRHVYENPCISHRKPVYSHIRILDSKYFIQNVESVNYIDVLRDICAYYVWYPPTYHYTTMQDEYYETLYHYNINLCVGAPFQNPPIYVGPISGTYFHGSDYEARNDAAKNAVNYFDDVCCTFNRKTEVNLASQWQSKF